MQDEAEENEKFKFEGSMTRPAAAPAGTRTIIVFERAAEVRYMTRMVNAVPGRRWQA